MALSVTTLAASAIGTTTTATANAQSQQAQPPPQQAAQGTAIGNTTVGPPDPNGATPLNIRPNKPLTLADENASSGVGWKLLLVAILAGGGYWVWRRRRDALAEVTVDAGTLTIVKRAPIGVRTELLLVEADGQRLLLGVTPQSIQTLALLGDMNEASQASGVGIAAPGALAAAPAVENLGDRFASILDAAGRPSAVGPVSGRQSTASPVRQQLDEEPVEGQARGLLDLVGRR